MSSFWGPLQIGRTVVIKKHSGVEVVGVVLNLEDDGGEHRILEMLTTGIHKSVEKFHSEEIATITQH